MVELLSPKVYPFIYKNKKNNKNILVGIHCKETMRMYNKLRSGFTGSAPMFAAQRTVKLVIPM